MLRGSLVGKSIPIQGVIQPIPAPITRENTPRPISTMCSGSQSKDIEPSVAISKAGNRPPPVDPITILFPFLPCNRLSIYDQPMTGRAVDDSLVQKCQSSHMAAVYHERESYSACW